MFFNATLRQAAYLFFTGVGASSAALTAESAIDAAMEQPVFPAGVERVTVDVAVVDQDGQPVAGLTPQDFLIKEEGAPQTIAVFEAIEIPQASPKETPSVRARVSSNTDELRRFGRTFVIVFDGLNLGPSGADAARSAIASSESRTKWRER
jgi:VWFA-related protein